MKQLIKKYKEPTPPYWRMLGDYALVLMVAIEAALPTLPLSENAHKWTAFAVSIIGVSVKFWTNTKSSRQ